MCTHEDNVYTYTIGFKTKALLSYDEIRMKRALLIKEADEIEQMMEGMDMEDKQDQEMEIIGRQSDLS